MQIQFEISGGIAYLPGLSGPFTLDTAQLEREDAKQIEALIKRADFFRQSSSPEAPARGAADCRTYIITIDDGQRSHVVRVRDPVRDDSLQALIQRLESVVRASKQRSPKKGVTQ